MYKLGHIQMNMTNHYAVIKVIFFMLIFLLLSISVSSASFNTSDLQGKWKGFQIFSSSSGWEGWDRDDVSIDSSGNFRIEWSDSDHSSGTNSGKLSIDNNGVITAAGYPSLEGMMSPDKNFFAFTTDYEGGDNDDPNLAIAIKDSDTSFDTSDLQGKWKGFQIFSSSSGWEGWDRDDVSIDSSGNFRIEWSDSDHSSGTNSGKLSIDNNGVITAAGYPSLEGMMSPDKNFFAFTTDYEGGDNDDPNLAIAIKDSDTSFDTSDLQGEWKGFQIFSSPSGWEGWDREDITIDSSGKFNAEWSDSDQSSGTNSGTLSIDNNGVITAVGYPSLEGMMSPNKNFFVFTTDYEGEGDPGLMIAVKKSQDDDIAAGITTELSFEKIELRQNDLFYYKFSKYFSSLSDSDEDEPQELERIINLIRSGNTAYYEIEPEFKVNNSIIESTLTSATMIDTQGNKYVCDIDLDDHAESGYTAYESMAVDANGSEIYSDYQELKERFQGEVTLKMSFADGKNATQTVNIDRFEFPDMPVGKVKDWGSISKFELYDSGADEYGVECYLRNQDHWEKELGRNYANTPGSMELNIDDYSQEKGIYVAVLLSDYEFTSSSFLNKSMRYQRGRVSIPYDIDGDMSITLKDIIVGLQINCGINPNVETFLSADINEDNKIGLTGVIRALQILSGEVNE